MKNKIDYLEQIELKVKDIAEDFTRKAVIQDRGEITGNDTLFIVDLAAGFSINDDIYLTDNCGNSVFSKVTDIILPNKIKVEGNRESYQRGALIKKSDSNRFLDEAVILYSKYSPLVRINSVVVSTPGNIFSVPEDWEKCFSKINSIEYPTGYFLPCILNPDDYSIVTDDGENFKIEFKMTIYSDFKIEYITGHVFGNENPPVPTIPEFDFYCVCNIAAAFYLLAMANRYCEKVNPALGASSVNFDDKSKKFRALAGDLLTQAASWLGLSVNIKDSLILEQLPHSSDQGVTK